MTHWPRRQLPACIIMQSWALVHGRAFGREGVDYPEAGPPQNLELGPVHPQDCEVCQREQPFRLVLSYRYERMWDVFGNLRGRSYLLVCEVCRTAYRIPRDTALRLAKLDREPIPFLHRYGCLLVWLTVIVVGLVGLVLERWK